VSEYAGRNSATLRTLPTTSVARSLVAGTGPQASTRRHTADCFPARAMAPRRFPSQSNIAEPLYVVCLQLLNTVRDLRRGGAVPRSGVRSLPSVAQLTPECWPACQSRPTRAPNGVQGTGLPPPPWTARVCRTVGVLLTIARRITRRPGRVRRRRSRRR